MTINFHKKTGRPSNVAKGHSDVWFSTLGLYVSDNSGKPRLISSSTSAGTTTPVGNPGEANRLYFNTTTRKHYISTDTKWLEIPTSGIPGSGTGGGNASNVMIDDAGNWYTSNDVEGTLGEIGERLPHIFGDGLLPTYGGNTLQIKTASEYLLNATATNKPSTTTSWLTSRKASNGDIYGLAIDKNGDAFSRVNSSFVKLARRTEIDSANQAIANLSSKFTKDMLAWKVKTLGAGYGLAIESNAWGAYKVHLTPPTQNAINLVNNNTYVKKNGDTMTSNLTVVGGVDEGAVLVRDRNLTNYIGLWATKSGMGIWDYGRNRPLIHSYNNGSTYIYGYGKTVSKFIVEHKIDFESSAGQGTSYPFVFRAKGTNSPVFIEGSHSRHLFGGNTSKGVSYIDTASASGKAQELHFGVIGGAKLPLVRFRANTVHVEGKFTSLTGIHIGTNPDSSDGAGPGNNTGAKVYLFPYRHNGSVEQRRRYAGIGYSATDHTVTFHSAERLPGMGSTGYNQVKIVAGGYITKSSEVYKDIHGEFEVPVLESIKKMKPYVFNYKGSPKAELGFILERNVPKILQEGGEEIDGKGLNAYSLVAYLWKGVQELTEKIEELEKKVLN